MIPSDNDLIAQFAISQDKKLFTELVVRHQSVIRQFLRRLTAGDYHLAEDISQETFWLAYQKIATYSGTGTFRSWLHTLAYRLFLKQLPKVTVLSYEQLVQDFETNGSKLGQQAQAEDANDEQAQIEADMYAEKLMAILSIEERVAMTLSYGAQMSHNDISQMCDIPLGTVKSHIQRGKQKIQKVVAHHQAQDAA